MILLAKWRVDEHTVSFLLSCFTTRNILLFSLVTSSSSIFTSYIS